MKAGTPDGWVSCTLGDVADFKTGKLNSNAATPRGAYPFFTCSAETLRTDTYSFDTECVLLAGNNADGVYPIKYFRGKFDVYQRTYVIQTRDASALSNRYLYYALVPKLDLLKSLSTGVATKFLTLSILKEIEIDIPSMETQNKITDILGSCDDLLETCVGRTRILEEMAQSLYQEWFVHFRYPGHEGVKMKTSSLGNIPKDWEVVPFKELVQCLRESTGPGEHLRDRFYVPIDCIPRH